MVGEADSGGASIAESNQHTVTLTAAQVELGCQMLNCNKHTACGAVQELKLKLGGVKLLSSTFLWQMTLQQRQACARELQQAAELLAAVLSLVLGLELGSNAAWKRSFHLTLWPVDEVLTVDFIGALRPLASVA